MRDSFAFALFCCTRRHWTQFRRHARDVFINRPRCRRSSGRPSRQRTSVSVVLQPPNSTPFAAAQRVNNHLS